MRVAKDFVKAERPVSPGYVPTCLTCVVGRIHQRVGKIPSETCACGAHPSSGFPLRRRPLATSGHSGRLSGWGFWGLGCSLTLVASLCRIDECELIRERTHPLPSIEGSQL